MSLYSQAYNPDFYPAMPVIDIRVQRDIDEASIAVTAIVDSGADSTMMPVAILQQLGVQSTRTAWMVSVANSRTAVALYWLFIQIGTFRPIYTEVIGTKNQNEIIIGRDILNQFAVLLDGPAHMTEIS